MVTTIPVVYLQVSYLLGTCSYGTHMIPVCIVPVGYLYAKVHGVTFRQT